MSYEEQDDALAIDTFQELHLQVKLTGCEAEGEEI